MLQQDCYEEKQFSENVKSYSRSCSQEYIAIF